MRAREVRGPKTEESRIAATVTTNETRINDRIRAREVRLVDPDGEQLGIKLLPEALAIARQLDLDLVEVAPGANPPVCRIMDYGKFKFDAAQRAKESRRKAVHVGIKEMKYRPKIGPGDFDTKTRQVAKFLEEGHKVKITIMFRGREVFHPELGKKILDRIAEQMDGMGKSEAVPRLDGRNMVMVLAPDKRAKQSAASKGPGHEGNGSAPKSESASAVATTEGATDAAAPTTEPTTEAAAPTTAPTGAGPAGQTVAAEATTEPEAPVAVAAQTPEDQPPAAESKTGA
jgi:translation initiation factor IF-3